MKNHSLHPFLRESIRLTVLSALCTALPARAVTYTTSTSGLWDTTTWTPVGVPAAGPQTGAAGGDDAIIDGAGVIVNFTDGMGTGGPQASDFTVGNGNAMTIRNGGTFSRDTSGTNWVRIGNNGTTGTVNIEDGTWDQQQAHIRIGVNGGTGEFNIGDGVGAAGSAIYNHAAAAGDFTLGQNNGGSGQGVVVVNSDGLLHVEGDWMHIGRDNFGGVQSSLTVNAGGQFTHGDGTTNGGGLEIGRNAGANGLVDINGGNVDFGVAGSGINREVTVGYDGAGELKIQNGGTWDQHTGLIRVGRGGTSTTNTGSLIVDGAGSVLNLGAGGTNQVELSVGYDGMGSLDISNGGVVNSLDDDVILGQTGSGVGIATVASGGILNHTAVGRWFKIGDDGSGTLNVDGGTVNVTATTVRLADDANSSGTLNVTDGAFNLTSNDHLELLVGTTTVNQTGGAINLDNNFLLDTGGTGDVDITGGMLTVGGDIQDRGGFTDFLIGGNATVTAANVLFNDGGDSPMDDIFTVEGASQMLTIANDLVVNNDDVFKFVLDGSTAAFNAIAVGNNLDLSGAVGMFDVSAWGNGWVPLNTEISLINIANGGSNGSGGIFENFGELDVVGTNGSTSFLLSRFGGDGNDLVLIVVPEPSRAMLLLVGLGAGLLRRRRN